METIEIESLEEEYKGYRLFKRHYKLNAMKSYIIQNEYIWELSYDYYFMMDMEAKITYNCDM